MYVRCVGKQVLSCMYLRMFSVLVTTLANSFSLRRIYYLKFWFRLRKLCKLLDPIKRSDVESLCHSAIG